MVDYPINYFKTSCNFERKNNKSEKILKIVCSLLVEKKPVPFCASMIPAGSESCKKHIYSSEVKVQATIKTGYNFFSNLSC